MDRGAERLGGLAGLLAVGQLLHNAPFSDGEGVEALLQEAIEGVAVLPGARIAEERLLGEVDVGAIVACFAGEEFLIEVAEFRLTLGGSERGPEDLETLTGARFDEGADEEAIDEHQALVVAGRELGRRLPPHP